MRSIPAISITRTPLQKINPAVKRGDNRKVIWVEVEVTTS
jgi:hypothetical protein